MLDVLKLPGIRPVDLCREHGVIRIVAEVLGEDLPGLPDLWQVGLSPRLSDYDSRVRPLYTNPGRLVRGELG